jgi:hypothetical protein
MVTRATLPTFSFSSFPSRASSNLPIVVLLADDPPTPCTWVAHRCPVLSSPNQPDLLHSAISNPLHYARGLQVQLDRDRVPVDGVVQMDGVTALAGQRPVEMGDRLLRLIEKAIDLPLDAVTHQRALPPRHPLQAVGG